MSDASVDATLQSSARLIVIEAPAGCGKTFRGARYAKGLPATLGDGRVLILAHTHAACDAFASRTQGSERSIDIRTIDSLVAEIAGAYHETLGLPADTGTWARSQKDGYNHLVTKVARLLRASPMISRSLAQRYPIVICDEHQDANADQHAIVMACCEGGAAVRIFGDPMQKIYVSGKEAIEADNQRWADLKQNADILDELDEPHRWSGDARPLGNWILEARSTLRAGGKVDLSRTLPPCVSVIIAENQSPKSRGVYFLAKDEAKPIRTLVNETDSLLVLATQNDTVKALRSFFFRSLPIWEGHMRENLAHLTDQVGKSKGDAASIAQAVISFLDSVAKGFSASEFGNTVLEEVRCGCVTKRRGKPAVLQALGRTILNQPNHKGVSSFLRRLFDLTKTDPAFATIKFDYSREFWDAIHIGKFDNMNEGFAEILRRRSYARPLPPAKAISTVHKAKGLECASVLIMPCDAQHYRDTPSARCLLYVAMSRAMRSLTFVVSRQKPSPLFVLAP